MPIASSCTREEGQFTVMNKNIRAFLACYIVFGAIAVVLAHGEERKTLPGGLVCVRRNYIGDSKHIWFEIEEEKYICYTGDGKSNCQQVSLLPIEKKSCLDCCKRKKEKGEETRKKTDRLHKRNIIGITVGCAILVLSIVAGIGLVVVRYKQREDRHGQNQNQQEQNLLKQVVQVQPKLQKLEVKPEQTTEDEELQGRSYAGLRESIV